jgi:hypothetical protein
LWRWLAAHAQRLRGHSDCSPTIGRFHFSPGTQLFNQMCEFGVYYIFADSRQSCGADWWLTLSVCEDTRTVHQLLGNSIPHRVLSCSIKYMCFRYAIYLLIHIKVVAAVVQLNLLLFLFHS